MTSKDWVWQLFFQNKILFWTFLFTCWSGLCRFSIFVSVITLKFVLYCLLCYIACLFRFDIMSIGRKKYFRIKFFQSVVRFVCRYGGLLVFSGGKAGGSKSIGIHHNGCRVVWSLWLSERHIVFVRLTSEARCLPLSESERKQGSDVIPKCALYNGSKYEI